MWTGPSYCSSHDVKSLVATSISHRDINLSLCSFQLVSSDVATSISCRDITLCLCRFQLVAHDVATSISCRYINLRNCNLQLSTSIVATSISCRNINLCLWRLHWLFLVSRLQSSVATPVLCRDNSLSHTSFIFFKHVIALRRFSCRNLHPLSRHQPLSRHHDVVATSFLKPLVNPQLPNL